MSKEPCGALPISGINVSAVYCHTHQAWSAHVQTFWERNTGDPTTTHSESIRFGPFDTEDDVRAWLLRALLCVDDLLA